MATQGTDQTALSILGNPPAPRPVRDTGGRVRCLCWSLQTSATIGVQNDVFIVGDLPAGARVLNIIWRSGAMGGASTFSLGNSTTAGKYVSAVSNAAAVENQTGATSLATSFLSTTTTMDGTTSGVTEGSAFAGKLGAVERVLGTFGGATWATAKTHEGVIFFVVD